MARQAFNPEAFSAAAFSAETDAADPAFDGGAFLDLAFSATPSEALPHEPAFDGGAFLDAAFSATPSEAPLHEPAFDGGAFLDTAFIATTNDAPVFPGADVAFVALYPVPGLTVGVRYISGAARPLVGTVRSPFQQAKPAESGWSDGARDSQRFPTGFSTLYQDGAPARVAVTSAYGEATHFLDALRGRYQRALGVSAAARSKWQEGDRVRQALAGVFQRARRLPTRLVAQRFQDATHTRQRLDSSFQHALPMRAGVVPGFRIAELARLFLDSRYQDAAPVRAGVSEHPVNPPGPVDPGEGETVIVPVRRIYTVINSATLRRVEGDVLIPTMGMTLDLDFESWTWGFSARVPGAALADLEPVDGTPVEVEALINGVAYRAIVEGLSRDRTFGRADLAVRGRGRAAVLDAPFAPVQTFGNTAERTLQQLANDVLFINGVPMGWDVDTGWEPENWSIAAGVFSHQGTYMSALTTIAQAAGAYVQPHRTLDALMFKLRYPSKPWEWSTLEPDFVLPADVVQREAIEWVEKPVFNRVYVRGTKAGYLGRVTREGTAGDVEAPMITDALMTDAIGIRQRAMPVLSDVGRQAIVTLRMPVLQETGIIPPGKFVRYVDGGVTRIGLTRSVRADVDRAEEGGLTIWQSIGVETHV